MNVAVLGCTGGNSAKQREAIVQSIGADIAAVHESAKRLQRALSAGPTPQSVNSTSGPVAVPASSYFDSALKAAAYKISVDLETIMKLLDNHAEALKAAAETLMEADAAAGNLTAEDQAALEAAQGLTQTVTDAGRWADSHTNQDNYVPVVDPEHDARTSGY